MNVRQTTDMHAALQHLDRATPFDVDGDLATDIRTRLHGAAVFDLVEDGRAVGAFALTVEGEGVRVLAAGVEPGHAALATIAEFTEREARDRIGARFVQCETRRPGLVRQLARLGYRVSGYILTKDMQ